MSLSCACRAPAVCGTLLYACARARYLGHVTDARPAPAGPETRGLCQADRQVRVAQRLGPRPLQHDEHASEQP
eukprot:2586896-Lingulodinium_polyedra.AAC.1